MNKLANDALAPCVTEASIPILNGAAVTLGVCVAVPAWTRATPEISSTRVPPMPTHIRAIGADPFAWTVVAMKYQFPMVGVNELAYRHRFVGMEALLVQSSTSGPPAALA